MATVNKTFEAGCDCVGERHHQGRDQSLQRPDKIHTVSAIHRKFWPRNNYRA
jgi:hypothetical protein